MSYFYRKKLNAQGRYINPPVHATLKKNKKINVTGITDAPVMKYKFERGPLKETTSERLARQSKEAEERYYARQQEKEANKMFKRKTAEEKRAIKEAKQKALRAVQKQKFIAHLANQKAKEDEEAERQRAKDDKKSAGQKRWAEVREMRRLQKENRAKCGAPKGKYKRSDATKQAMSKSAKLRWAGQKQTEEEKRMKRNAYQNARNARLRAEAKNKSTSLVITITITDPNKS